MTMPCHDKPLEALREETVDRLIMNYGHGRLSLAAFERRLDTAFDASEHGALAALTSDLELEVDAAYIEQKRRELGISGSSTAAKDVEHIINVFSVGSERTGPWTVPRELRIVTIFGVTDIDFSEARFSHEETRVKVFCLFGAVDLFVREDVNTTVKTFCVLGAVDNQVPASTAAAPISLVVNGLVLFGALDAKIRKTFKQRVREFADGVRALFVKQPAARRRDD